MPVFSPSQLPPPAQLLLLLLTSANRELRKTGQSSLIFKGFSTNMHERIKSLAKICELCTDSRILSQFLQ